MMNKDLEALVKYIRLEKEYIGNDIYRLYIKKNGMDFLEQALLKAQEQEKENIKYKKLEEQIGCPVDVYAKIQCGLVDTIYVKRYETVRKYWNEEGLQLEQREVLCARKITRVEQKYFYYRDFLGKESLGFSQYGKEFWLKEDKSE